MTTRATSRECWGFMRAESLRAGMHIEHAETGYTRTICEAHRTPASKLVFLVFSNDPQDISIYAPKALVSVVLL